MNNSMTKSAWAVLLLLTAARIPAQDSDVAQQVREMEMQWNRDFASRDIDSIASHYTSDATMMAPGHSPCMGTDAIRRALRQMLADNAFSLKFHSDRVVSARSGDFAWSEGSYVVTMTDSVTGKPATSTGNYVTVYKKDGGAWKAVSDIASPGPVAPGVGVQEESRQ